MRIHLAYLYSNQSLRRSAIVLIVFLYYNMSEKKSSKGTFVYTHTDSTTSLYLYMKLIIAFP